MKKDDLIIQAIIDAAKKLMQQYGLTKTTMEDIAKAAGKGKTTLYHYFKSKEEIFDEVINQEMDSFFHEVKQAVDQEASAIDKLKTYIVIKIQTLKQKVNLYRFAIEADAQTLQINTQFKRLRERYDRRETELTLSILQLGVEQTDFRQRQESDMLMLAELLVTCVRGVELDVITHDKFSILPDQADLLVEVLAKGLS